MMRPTASDNVKMWPNFFTSSCLESKHCAGDDDSHSDFGCDSNCCYKRWPVSWSLWSQATNSRRVLGWQGRKFSCLSISLSSVLQVQSGASGWEKGFVKCFLKVPIAYFGSTEAAVQPSGLWNSQKTFYKTWKQPDGGQRHSVSVGTLSGSGQPHPDSGQPARNSIGIAMNNRITTKGLGSDMSWLRFAPRGENWTV